MTPQTLFDIPPLPPPEAMRFNGPAYDPDKDRERLAGQILRIYDLMADGRWRTLGEFRQSRVVVRYGDAPLIRELYPVERWDVREQTGRTQGNNDLRELLIVNRPAAGEVRDA